MDYGIWGDDVTYDDTGFFYFAADFDNDGDDDMLLASGVWRGTIEEVSANVIAGSASTTPALAPMVLPGE